MSYFTTYLFASKAEIKGWEAWCGRFHVFYPLSLAFLALRQVGNHGVPKLHSFLILGHYKFLSDPASICIIECKA